MQAHPALQFDLRLWKIKRRFSRSANRIWPIRVDYSEDRRYVAVHWHHAALYVWQADRDRKKRYPESLEGMDQLPLSV